LIVNYAISFIPKPPSSENERSATGEVTDDKQRWKRNDDCRPSMPTATPNQNRATRNRNKNADHRQKKNFAVTSIG